MLHFRQVCIYQNSFLFYVNVIKTVENDSHITIAKTNDEVKHILRPVLIKLLNLYVTGYIKTTRDKNILRQQLLLAHNGTTGTGYATPDFVRALNSLILES